MNMSKKEYVYEVEEYSQDTRHYEVTSNVKLTEYELQQIYGEVDINKSGDTTNDLQKYISWEDKRFSDDEIENKVKVSVKFNGTEYGDDCQVDTTGEFEESV
tara:strand:- start:167 stop:472 length:306 start_codon:yes stop_codon:yes gene_type:complete